MKKKSMKTILKLDAISLYVFKLNIGINFCSMGQLVWLGSFMNHTGWMSPGSSVFRSLMPGKRCRE